MRAETGYGRLYLLVRGLTVGVVTGILLGFTAPYPTGLVFSARERFAFWIWSSVAGTLLLTACDWVARELTMEHRIPRYVSSATAILTAAIPTTLIVHATAPAINDQIRLLPFWQLFPSALILCIPGRLFWCCFQAQHAAKQRRRKSPLPRSRVRRCSTRFPPHWAAISCA